jgi:stage V sporulation protein R
MKKQDLQRLSKIEERIKQIVVDELGLKVYDIEFDVCNAQKMLEIMAYRIPTNISNWKYGRNYEKQRTIYEHQGSSLPYEVVINSDPSRAYLMADNTFAVQCLVMAHVYGHVNVFAENQYFRNSRQDIMGVMSQANDRFNEYERKYSIDEVEAVVDAGHSIQLHSSPFETETEKEKFERIYSQIKATIVSKQQITSEFGDLMPNTSINEIDADMELVLQKIRRTLKLKTPVEPTSDILRYIIDNSRILEDWQIDVLEMLRMEGQYFWPMMRTQFLNEGWAVHIHEKVMRQLFNEGLLDDSEHAQYNYSNSLVKAENPFRMNPYLVGSTIWKDIEDRWDKGKHGREWDDCEDCKLKEDWDTKEKGKGWEKCKSTMRVFTDWMFMQNFLTPDLVRELKLYIYVYHETPTTEEYVIADAEAEEIKNIIVSRFSHGVVPDIEIIDGNVDGSGGIYLKHNWAGLDLDKKYAEETCKHICRLWGSKVYLETEVDGQPIKYVANSMPVLGI